MKSPLPPREGISANRLRAPGGLQTHAGAHLPVPATVGQWLAGLFPAAAPSELTALLDPAAGDMRDESGAPVEAGDPPHPGGFYFFHRPVPPEARIPFEVTTVYEDADLLVVDKPHFLASTPNGRFVRECVVTRARVERDEPDLVAIHRLDRVTAGLLVLSRRPQTRGAYQSLFQARRVHKQYLALARLPRGFDPETFAGGFPLERHSRLDKEPGTRQMLEVPGPANAHTTLEFVRAVASAQGEARTGLFRLHPHTGRTHQLRVHMNALGLPILGDPVYPRDLAPDPYDFSSPLQLLAHRLAFTDPLTGREREFESRLWDQDGVHDAGGTLSL
ncbi:pseudouridine synthase [Brevibacterium sp. 50QC2O2]|uniref:pseudouridine synthase n=1 Tax=Brevibacterium sp. 50QC2O2 TaxID=2968459 RepID=UPI00211C6D31|nr:pseudouridine synthase [Brevibacterium sp. 50QC2O2]